ncbi:MAG TPA: DUF3000 domain-containing protein [Streptosporangiaceae bacterium]|nr:DUF3000 domain-containing protein [Streptosporangiaceae bacterium]
MSPAGRAAPRQAAAAAAIFRGAAADLEAERDRQTVLRPELTFEDVPAPRKLAPYAAVLSAAVRTDGTEVASGRLILLYDPACQQGWVGPFRIVAQIQADLDAEIAVDPLLGAVGWSWLTEALDAHAAQYAAPSGTVTRVVTEGFGAKGCDPAATEFELRASWSPAQPHGESGQPSSAQPSSAQPSAGQPSAGQPSFTGHVAAWCDALCAAAGLAPLEPGVSALPSPAARRRAASGRTSTHAVHHEGPAVR